MKTATYNWRTGSWQKSITGGFTAIEGSREAQFIDYSVVEESYELLPSGD